ncbi:MAG: pseudouridine synthase [Verrucomicrobiota bacterium]
MVRLQKFLADAGIASRRASEKIILDGQVSVNGKEVRQLGTKVDPDHDRVEVDGRRVKPKRKIYVALNKPRKFLCAREEGSPRRLVGDLLPREWNNLYSVGRLDYESEGLIFLTNDGEFCLRLTHPRYGVRKTYLATVEGKAGTEVLRKLTHGILDGGETLKAERARLLSASNSKSVIELEMSEGKNREVRRMFESQGLTVVRLQRIKIGPIKLGELPEGKWRALTESEIKSLLSKL